MADGAAIVRLMKHAADRLAEEDVYEIASLGTRAERADQAASVGMTMTYAEAILRTVAAALDETPEVTP